MGLVLASPYTPGSGLLPPLLAGRDAELVKVRAALARLASSGRGSSPLVLTGSRGVGKTVLLRSVEADARAAGAVVAYLTLDRGSSAPVRLAQAVGLGLQQALGQRGGQRWSRLRAALAQFTVQLSVPGVTGSSRERPAAAATPVDRDELTRLLIEAGTLARQHGHGGLLVMLDEVQEPPAADLVVLVNTVQDVAGLAGPVQVVAAGLPQAPDVLMAAGSFAERFTYLGLGRLEPDSALLALLEPARARQVRWAGPASDRLLEAASGQLYLIQLYADHAWSAAAPRSGDPVNGAAVHAGLQTARRQLADGLFRGRFNQTGAVERQVLLAVAEVLRSDGTAALGDVLAATGRTGPQLSGVRQRLLDKGLLEAPSRGVIRLSLPGFEEFLRDQAGLPDRP